ncbi:MAG: hypothetical protein AVDCRST_MAG59-89 [uncultured Thermomicrobiales bacterium]|uniref:Uncharacterized protein n=1 Tax=uncultured Thermomicrobiales bacterium TaxID=1645740 RepID=A0A6J4TWA6_9BACT|nr:MAG: hypothetical protein AVDCRST_MAG59-89 [uncultured Thermomicrobiales bacterium]
MPRALGWQQPARLEVGDESLSQRPAAGVTEADGVSDERDAVGEVGRDLSGGKGEAGLAAAGAAQGDERDIVAAEDGGDGSDVLLTSDQSGTGERQGGEDFGNVVGNRRDREEAEPGTRVRRAVVHRGHRLA